MPRLYKGAKAGYSMGHIARRWRHLTAGCRSSGDALFHVRRSTPKLNIAGTTGA